MPTISDQQKLTAFRNANGAAEILAMLKDHPLLFITWAVGVGKSYLINRIIEYAMMSGLYDLIMVFVPTRAVLDEQAWITKPPPGVKVINLRPRPADLCGPMLDDQMKDYERRGMSLLGKTQICGKLCQNRSACFWHGQYGSKAMAGAKVVFGTQAHLERDPLFVSRVQSWVGAERPLLLLDEANFVAKSRKVVISGDDLKCYLAVLDKIHGQP